MYRFELPLSVTLPRKTKKDRKVMLNMNTNWNRFLYQECKKLFYPIYYERFRANKIMITYFVEKKHKRSFDTRNITSIVDKFLCDWLQEENMIPDDSFKNVRHGGDDGTNDCKDNKVIAYIEIEE